jgi:hypothetical protein
MAGLGALTDTSGAAAAPVYQTQGNVNPWAQLGIALGNLPNQQKNAQMQQQLVEQQKLQMEAQKAQVGQQLYGQIGQILAADPTKANDPALLKRAQDIYKATNVPLPFRTDEHGNTILDVDLLNPTPDYDTMKPADRIKFGADLLSKPVDQRAALIGKMRNVPSELLTADQYIAPTAGAETQYVKQLGDDVQKVSAGTLDPIRFATMVQANSKIYKAMGVDTSQYLSPEFLNAGISKYASAQIDWMKERGIHLQNADATAKKIADDRAREATQRITLQGQALTEHVREFDARQQQLWATHIDNMSIAERRLADTERGLDSLIGNRTFMQGIQTVTALSKPLTDLRSQYDSAQAQLVSVNKAIAANAAAGNPPSDALQKQYDALASHVAELKPKLDYYGTIVQNAANAAAGGIVGKPVIATKPPAPPSTPPAGPDPTKPPKPGYKLQSDGAGHYRWWNGKDAIDAK